MELENAGFQKGPSPFPCSGSMLIFGVCHDMSFEKRLSSRQHLQAESSTAFHIQLLRILVDSRNQNWDTGKKKHINPIPTFDGRNPAPVDVVDIPVFIGFYTSQVVQDFFHHVYGSCVFFGKGFPYMTNLC